MREHVMKQTIVVGKRIVGDGIYCIKKLGIIHDRRKGAIGGRQIIGKQKEGWRAPGSERVNEGEYDVGS